MHLFFDLDGTLTDPFEGITKSIQHALSALGRPVPPAEELRWCIGPPLKKGFEKLLGEDRAGLADTAVAKYREHFSAVGLFENRVYAGIPSLLEDLAKKGHALRVATSKPRVFAVRIIEYFGLQHFFVSIDGSELDGTRSDKGALLRYVLEREKIAVSQALIVGDREHDVLGARENGLNAVGVLWGYGSSEELLKAGALGCVKTPVELGQRIEELVC